MLRLFIALPLPAEVETALGRILDDLRPRSHDVKWVPSKNIHLTVKFLGDTEASLVDKIKAAIYQVAAICQPIEGVIDRIGGFPNLKRPRVIWVGESEPSEQAARIAGQLDLRLRKLGFEPESRPFNGHLTLGRVRQGRRIDDLAKQLEGYAFSPIPVRLDRLVLFKSILGPGGATYERLHEAALGAERFSG